MVNDKSKNSGDDARPEYGGKFAARNEFAGGDYKGAVIDSAHMINLSDSSALNQRQKQQPKSSGQGITANSVFEPSAE